MYTSAYQGPVTVKLNAPALGSRPFFYRLAVDISQDQPLPQPLPLLNPLAFEDGLLRWLPPYELQPTLSRADSKSQAATLQQAVVGYAIHDEFGRTLGLVGPAARRLHLPSSLLENHDTIGVSYYTENANSPIRYVALNQQAPDNNPKNLSTTLPPPNDAHNSAPPKSDSHSSQDNGSSIDNKTERTQPPKHIAYDTTRIQAPTAIQQIERTGTLHPANRNASLAPTQLTGPAKNRQSHQSTDMVFTEPSEISKHQLIPRGFSGIKVVFVTTIIIAIIACVALFRRKLL